MTQRLFQATNERISNSSATTIAQKKLNKSRQSFIRAICALSTGSFLLSRVHGIALMAQASNSGANQEKYSGTATERMNECKSRARRLTELELSKDWDSEVRPRLLYAAGLRDINAMSRVGTGYTGHCFNDFNHVDATTMILDVADSENEGNIRGIAKGNQLGDGIRAASLEDAGPGGSWCTCSLGANSEPPHDVAHVQFNSKIAWKLVWVPGQNNDFSRFVLVDDEGKKLTTGVPTGNIPHKSERMQNFRMLIGGRYAECANEYSNDAVDGFSAR
jgi:hypothetical protein